MERNAQNRPICLIPLSALPEPAQKKYIADHSPAVKTAAPAVAQDKPAPKNKPLESYTAEERAEISCWIALVEQWQEYRSKAGKKKAECDEKFVLLRQLEEPERQISVETLYRKWRRSARETWMPWWISAARPARARPCCCRRSSRNF